MKLFIYAYMYILILISKFKINLIHNYKDIMFYAKTLLTVYPANHLTYKLNTVINIFIEAYARSFIS
jgi:hypothetical protein